jgi:spermidine synthase
MIRWEQLAAAPIPDAEGSLRLMRRGAEYSIMTGGTELMNSRMSGSEKALATLAIARLQGRAEPRILIGGLGMGFTLRAALEVLPPGAVVEVAEIVPAVLDWARGPMAEIFEGCLDDPRVAIRLGDVGEIIRAARGGYDAILLDVDNGPGGLDRAENDRLYNHGGLAAAKAALTPGGVLAVWSFAPDDYFVRRLRASGFEVREERVNAHRKGRGARHVVWLAS